MKLSTLRVALCALAMGISTVMSACGGGGGHGGGLPAFTTVYAADGRGGTPGNLYAIAAPGATPVTVGALAFSVGAMATSPGGTIFAVGTTNTNPGKGHLFTINQTNATMVTVVAQLETAGGTDYDSIAGLAFRGSTLFGFVADGTEAGGFDNELVTINTTTGIVTPIGHSTLGDYQGNGIAFSPNGTLFGTTNDDSDHILVTINPSTGIATTVSALTLNSTTNGTLKSLLFIGNTLFGVEHNNSSNGASLVSVNPTTATTTAVQLLAPRVSSLTFAP